MLSSINSLQRALPAVTVGLPGGAAAPAAPLQLRVRGPSRFLTIEAATAGGSAHVEVVQEGSLRLSTQGGAISVPKVLGTWWG